MLRSSFLFIYKITCYLKFSTPQVPTDCPAVLSSRSLQPFHSASMPVTPTQFRTLIDELDAILRRASGEGNLKTVFAAEKGRIVSPFIFFTLLLTHFILEHTHENSEGDQGPA